jgi:hypothetical protein
MGNIYLDDVINDPDMNEPFQIERSVDGQWTVGEFIDQKTIVDVIGVVSVITPEELKLLPEADRVTGARGFWATVPLYETHAQPSPGISDIMLWGGDKWRVLKVADYSNRGYWKATAVRMLGA